MHLAFLSVILQRQIAKESLVVFDGTKKNEKFTKEELKDCFILKDSDCDTKYKLGQTWPDYGTFISVFTLDVAHSRGVYL